MGAMKRNTLSVLFIIKKSELLKDSEAPTCMRTIVSKRVAEVIIKRSIPMDLWNQKKEYSKGKDCVAIELNHYINTTRAKVLQVRRELEIDNKLITADIIKDCFYGHGKVQRSLLEVYTEHNEKCRALINKEYAASTVIRFDTSTDHLKEYIRSCYHRDDIILSDVDGQFIRNFDFWLEADKHCQNNSALKHLKTLKKVVHIALAGDWIKKDPFHGIHFKRGEVEVEFLSCEELDILLNKEFTIKRLEQVRETFVFCCITALVFADVQQLLPLANQKVSKKTEQSKKGGRLI